MADWQKLADDFIREFDAVCLKRRDRDANRIDMEGNTNNEYMIGKRATMAANRINEQRGWIQSMTKREWNIDEITNTCIVALKSMDSFDFNTYEAKLRARGYGVKVMRDIIGKVCGYSVKKGNSTYKSSELGHSRANIFGLGLPPFVSPPPFTSTCRFYRRLFLRGRGHRGVTGCRCPSTRIGSGFSGTR